MVCGAHGEGISYIARRIRKGKALYVQIYIGGCSPKRLSPLRWSTSVLNMSHDRRAGAIENA